MGMLPFDIIFIALAKYCIPIQYYKSKSRPLLLYCSQKDIKVSYDVQSGPTLPTQNYPETYRLFCRVVINFIVSTCSVP